MNWMVYSDYAYEGGDDEVTSAKKDMAQYVASKSMITVKAAIAVVNDQGHILLQERADDGLWYMPLGVMKPGEMLEDTAYRELWEETGLTAEEMKFERLLSGPEFKRDYPSGDEEYYVIGVFRAQGVLYSELNYSSMQEGPMRFFALNEIPKLSPVTARVLSDYLDLTELN
ncbi:NUDIX domain-containing protein [Paenibacillus shunpengii]|uniref:NUDIX domain-containing protein n=1 Tax=Paenibacillus shunpengii TaxID=2054424 RepID=A0ABW5SLU7_9BACL|nr:MULTISPECIES: NUDIX domain-containing protein [unclassified Paenibacillus]